MTTALTQRRVWLLRLMAATISVGLALVACELFLRVVYRDGGRTTLGGPGGRDFVYTYSDGKSLRGPLDTGPKTPGVQRLMVMGDSITWGQGVTDWRDTYPARVLTALNANGARYDMAVYAVPGKEIDGHLSTISKAIAGVSPDIVVYQWYNNDVEISKDARPRSARAWRGWPMHGPLRAWSYLYFMLDFALDRSLPGSGRSYAQYLDEDFAAGTPGWTTFARTFHDWAAYATGYASRTIVMLYPMVPLDQVVDLRHRMATLAGGQVLSVPPGELAHDLGERAADGSAVSAPAGSAAGRLATTPRRVFAHGDYTASFQLRLDAPATGTVARVLVTSGDAAQPLASRDLGADAFTAAGTWQTVTLPFRIGDHVAADVKLHVDYLGQGGLSVGRIDVPVTYGIEVVDLAPLFEHVNPSSSLFDAHPNAQAHAAMSTALLAQIQTPPRR